jgi:hypothetical protein
MLSDAIARGEVAKREMVRDRILVAPDVLATLWQTPPERLNELESAGELFTVRVDEHPYVPALMLEVDEASTRRICLALQPIRGWPAFSFWYRRHGALRGLTLIQVLHQGIGLDRVLELADDWASEASGRDHG